MVEKDTSFGSGNLVDTAEKEEKIGSAGSLANREGTFAKLMRELTHTQKELAQYRQRYGDVKANRKYKDSVFTNLFAEKKYAFMLYKDLHPEDLEAAEEDVEVITVENIFTNDLYNDAAFRVGNRLITLAEHQSTYSFNIPMRMLLYIAEEYKRLLSGSMDVLYREGPVAVPAPEFYVIYTGKWKERYETELSLSGLFAQQTGYLELKVHVIYEPEEESILWEYSGMVKKMESLIADGVPKITAIETVVSEYQDPRYRISDFLKRRKDVSLMFNRDITLEEMINVRGREQWDKGRREGILEGRREGILEGKIWAYHDCGLPAKEIAKILSITEQHVDSVLNEKENKNRCR